MKSPLGAEAVSLGLHLSKGVVSNCSVELKLVTFPLPSSFCISHRDAKY